MTLFIDARQAQDKAAQIRSGEARVSVEMRTFGLVPKSPFSYWVPDTIRALFLAFPPLKSGRGQAWSGATTMDDFRHARCWFELSPPRPRGWVTFSKGGPHQRFYLPIYLVVDWRADGAEMKARISALREFRGHGNQWTAVLNGYRKYLEPGVYWSRRSLRGMSARILPAGSVFSDKSPTYVSESRSQTELLTKLAVLNSSTVRYLVAMQMAFGSYEVGVLNRTPIPPRTSEDSDLEAAALRGWRVLRELDTANETSGVFELPALLQTAGKRFADRARTRATQLASALSELNRIQAEIDERCADLYGVSEDDRQAIAKGFEDPDERHAPDDDDDDDVDTPGDGVLPTDLAAGLVSWAVGVAVGRFDLRLATSRMETGDPNPADPLPRCPPSILSDEDGSHFDPPPSTYPIDVSSVLVDDPGHPLDIHDRIRSVFEIVFGVDSDEWWSDLGEALGSKRGELSSWLSNELFDYHLRMYSKSRRKAPIYWALGTTSGSYRVWLYAHRTTGDSLFRVLNDVVSPKVALERRRWSELVQDAGPNPSASQRKAIDWQEKLVEELQQLVAELTAAAPLWHPDLNDGVVVVLAPLWRLFAHHKAWSKELHKHWDNLVAGEYDWAQLAMHLWPERVVPKCAEDRSLAIAHGLEAIFWMQEDANSDKWHPRRTPTVSVEQLVADRANPATKAAVEDASR